MCGVKEQSVSRTKCNLNGVIYGNELLALYSISPASEYSYDCRHRQLSLIIIICDIIAVELWVFSKGSMGPVPFQTGGARCSLSGLVPEWVCLRNVTTIGFYTPLSLAASCSMAEQFLRKSIQNCNFFSEPILRNQFKIVIFLKTETPKIGTWDR